jgi:hypothetical protein
MRVDDKIFGVAELLKNPSFLGVWAAVEEVAYIHGMKYSRARTVGKIHEILSC